MDGWNRSNYYIRPMYNSMWLNLYVEKKTRSLCGDSKEVINRRCVRVSEFKERTIGQKTRETREAIRGTGKE